MALYFFSPRSHAEFNKSDSTIQQIRVSEFICIALNYQESVDGIEERNEIISE